MTTSFKTFTGEVQHRIEAGDQAEAVRTTRAVLETLGERIDEGGATDIASPLPMEIDRYLLQVEHGQRFDLQEFIDRVLDRMNYDDLELETSFGAPAGIDEAEALFRAQAVIALVAEMIPGGNFAHVDDQLPGDFDGLFEFVDADQVPWE